MKKLLASLLLLASCLPWLAQAQDANGEKYQAGKHYQVLAIPVHTNNPDKIEVNEVFWYGCSHCYEFEHTVGPWAKALPDDVDFQRTPAIWRANMDSHARAYYAARQLNVLEAMHPIIFKAMHVDKNPLADEDQLARLFAANGVDEAAFRKAYNSFSVQSLTKQGDARVRSYGVEGTPEIIINGKYRISTHESGSQQAMLDVANFLIEKERRDKPAKQ